MESAIQALFSALTAVDGNGRYIRRPQTFAQLCDVSGLDGKTLNEVLRPFRLRSAGFLMPQGTQDLQGEDIVDISHEALIRHWGKLAGSLSQAGWIQSEAEDGQRYRALLDMIPDTLPSRKHMEWWKVRPRTAQWATRYGGKFGEVQELLARAKRRQGLIRVLGTLLLLFIPAIIGTAFYWQQVESRRKLQADANQALDDLLQELKSAQTARAISLASIGEQLLNRDGATRGLLVALEGLKGAGEPGNPNSLTDLPILPQTRRLAYRALQELRETYINPGPRFIPPQVSFVPETSLLVIGRSGSPLQFMDAKTGKIVAHADLSDLSSLISTKWVIGKDGLRLYLLGQDREQKNSVFSLDPCATQIASALSVCANAMPTRPAISKIMEIDQFPRAVSPDGRLVLTGGFGGQETRLWDLQEKRRIDVPLPTSFNAVFNSDSSAFALALGDGIRVYSTRDFSHFDLTADEMSRPGWKLFAFAFGPKGTAAEGKLFTATLGRARLWDLATKSDQPLPEPASGTLLAAFSPNGESIAATLDNGQIQVWRLTSDKPESFLLKGHAVFAFSLDFSTDGQTIASGSNDGTARVWRLHGVLAPEIATVELPPAETLQDQTVNGRILNDRAGILSVRNASETEPFVFLNGTPQKWRTYGFITDGVTAVSDSGRKYTWRIFANDKDLVEFARHHLPLCNGEPITMGPRERSILLGLSDAPQKPSPQVPVSATGLSSSQSASPEQTCGYARLD